MEGRAKVNLKVEGEVIAQMECNFEDKPITEKNLIDITPVNS